MARRPVLRILQRKLESKGENSFFMTFMFHVVFYKIFWYLENSYPLTSALQDAMGLLLSLWSAAFCFVDFYFVVSMFIFL